MTMVEFHNTMIGVLVMAAMALTSCSSYQRDFQQAVATAGGRYADPTGPFLGEWKSVPSGHEGPLWCMVSKSPGKPGHYDFRYRAGWGLFSFGDYTHTAPVRMRPDGSLVVTGDMELSEMVGTYALDGTVTKHRFDAKYTSTKGDHGTFSLQRSE